MRKVLVQLILAIALIKFTGGDGKPVYINPDKVVSVTTADPDEDGKEDDSIVIHAGDVDYYVSESMDAVVAKLRNK